VSLILWLRRSIELNFPTVNFIDVFIQAHLPIAKADVKETATYNLINYYKPANVLLLTKMSEYIVYSINDKLTNLFIDYYFFGRYKIGKISIENLHDLFTILLDFKYNERIIFTDIHRFFVEFINYDEQKLEDFTKNFFEILSNLSHEDLRDLFIILFGKVFNERIGIFDVTSFRTRTQNESKYELKQDNRNVDVTLRKLSHEDIRETIEMFFDVIKETRQQIQDIANKEFTNTTYEDLAPSSKYNKFFNIAKISTTNISDYKSFDYRYELFFRYILHTFVSIFYFSVRSIIYPKIKSREVMFYDKIATSINNIRDAIISVPSITKYDRAILDDVFNVMAESVRLYSIAPTRNTKHKLLFSFVLKYISINNNLIDKKSILFTILYDRYIINDFAIITKE
jgi:hypothetical protein